MEAQVQKINHRQFAYFIGILLIGGNLVSSFHEDFLISHVNAWFSHLLPGIYTLFVAHLFFRLAERYPGKNFFEITRICLGSWGGGLLNAVLLGHVWLILMRNLRGMADIVQLSMLPSTPESIVMLLFVLLLWYYLKGGIEVIVRINDLLFPLFILMALILPFLLLNEFDVAKMQPFLADSPWPVVKASLLNTGFYGDVAIMGALMHTLSVPRQMDSAVRSGTAWAMFILSLFFLIVAGVLGNIAGFSLFPQYTAVQQIHITDFLDRLDILALSVWIPIFVIKNAFISYAFMVGLASYSKKRDVQVLNKMVLFFILLTTLHAFDTTYELFEYANFASTAFTIAVEVLLVPLLLLFAAKRDVQVQTEQIPEAHTDQGRKSMKNRLSYRGWKRAGNLTLLGAGLVVAAGYVLGSNVPNAGNLAASAYLLALLLFIFTTYMELKVSSSMKVVKPSGQG